MNNSTISIVSVAIAAFSFFNVTIWAQDAPIFMETESGIRAKPGLSMWNPIVVHEKDFDGSEAFAKNYIRKNYPKYKIITISTLRNGDTHSIAKYSLEKEDEKDSQNMEVINLYFDIEEAMMEVRKKHKDKIRKRIKSVNSPVHGKDTQPGLSMENPIVIHEKDIEKAEYFASNYIETNYPDYQIAVITTAKNGKGHTIGNYYIFKEDEENSDKGQAIDLYFDIEEVIIEFLRKRQIENMNDVPVNTTVQAKSSENIRLGFSMENPIVIHEKNYGKAEAFARDYIRQNYPGYSIKASITTQNNINHTIRSYVFEREDEENAEKSDGIELYFDIQEAMIEVRKKHKVQIKNRIKQMGKS